MLLLGSLLFACSTSVKNKTPIELPEQFSETGSEELADRWWTVFGDPKLNQLIQKSLGKNFELKTAWDRLAQAREVANREDADLFPSLDASTEASRSASRSEGGAGGTFVGGSFVSGGGGGEITYSEEYTFNLNASYEVDIWGRVNAASDAAKFDAKATRQDLQAASLSTSSKVAETWYELVEERARLQLIDRQINTNEQQLELIQVRFRKGQVPATDVFQQRELLKSTQSLRSRTERNVETLRHQLAVLIGTPPTQVELPEKSSLPSLPPAPKTGIPAEWIRKRPDIRSAFLQLKSADRDAAAAFANEFPQFTITPSFRTTGVEYAKLFNDWTTRLMGNLVQPIIDGGRRNAETARARAKRSEELHNYLQTILTGMREVEDALSNERKQQKTLQHLQEQLDISNQTVQQLIERYKKGVTDFIRVLDELRNNQQLQRDVLSARSQLIQYRIDLYLALGGGWELSPPDNVPVEDFSN